MVLLFDIDDTLIEADLALRLPIEKATGKYGIKGWDYGLTPTEISKIWVDNKTLENLGNVGSDWVQSVKTWKKEKHLVSYITSRNWHKKAWHISKRQVGSVGTVHVVNYGVGSKKKLLAKYAVLAQKLGKESFYVDDVLSHVKDAKDTGITYPVLFTRDWNKDTFWPLRVSSKEEIKMLVTKLGNGKRNGKN